jgi:hypothetical protein
MASTASDGAIGSRRPSRRLIAGFAGPVALIALIAYVVAKHGGEFGRAAGRADLGTLALVTALALVTLLARTEAVVRCLAAMGNRPRRREIHAANAVTAIAMCVNHYVASPVRAALLRRIDRDRAPTIPQMIMVDASTTVIEAMLVAIVIVASAGTLKLPWWVAPLLAVAAFGGFGIALAARARLRQIPALRGLVVLAHASGRVVVGALMAGVIGCQIVRTLLVLRVTGLHPSLLQAAATFVAAGVLSTLFAGPTAGAAGAPLIVFGHRSIGAAGAAGVILSATAIVAAFLYAAPGGSLYLRQLRRAAR